MSVSIAMVRAMIVAVERAGVSRDELLRESGLDALRLEDPSAQLSLPEYERVQRAAIELSGNPGLALHIADEVGSAAFDLVGHLTEHAGTLRQAIDTLTRYARIVGQGPGMVLSEQGDTAWVRIAIGKEASPRARFVAELALSGLMRMLRSFVAADVNPRAVCFAYAAPAHRAEYTRIFGGNERFEQAYTGIEIERAWLDNEQLHRSRELYALLQGEAERALGRIERDVSAAERVRHRLAAHDPKAMPTMDAVARELGMSARSLRRRLSDEGVEYRELTQAALTSAAKRLLEDPGKSIQEAAFALGFATPAAFHRAFKRWTGKTPKAYKTSF